MAHQPHRPEKPAGAQPVPSAKEQLPQTTFFLRTKLLPPRPAPAISRGCVSAGPLRL